MESVKPKKNDKHILYYFWGAFIIVLIVNIYFVHTAINTHTGVVGKNTYKAGLKYNDVIAAKTKQDKLGWSSNISFKDNVISAELLDDNSNIIKDAKITAYFARPTSKGNDFSVALSLNNDGRYSSNVNLPLKGLWDVRLNILHSNEKYQTHKRIVVK